MFFVVCNIKLHASGFIWGICVSVFPLFCGVRREELCVFFVLMQGICLLPILYCECSSTSPCVGEKLEHANEREERRFNFLFKRLVNDVNVRGGEGF